MLQRKVILVELLLIIVLLSLAACGGGATSALVAVADETAPLDLAEEVDVHTVASVKDRDDVFLLDVREPWEYEEAHIPGVTLLPMGDVAANLDQIPTEKQVIVTCRSSNRSGQVAQYLRENGFDNISNMSGGILEWQTAGYPVEP
jgi:rhodanese-related sulfurtransferase